MVRSGIALVLAVLFAAPAQAQDRYALAGGCYVLAANGAQVARTADGGYRLAAQGERFRLKATALGRYLLYGTGRDFLAHGRGPLPISPPRVQSVAGDPGARPGPRRRSRRPGPVGRRHGRSLGRHAPSLAL